MLYPLTEQQTARYHSFRTFVKRKVLPNAGVWDREETIPPDIITEMGKEGYLGSIVQESFGGQAWDIVTFGLLNEAFGRGLSALTDLITVQSMVEVTLQKWGSESQKRWLPKLASGELIGAYAMTEPNAGSDLAAMETVFIPNGEGYILHGVKRWISFAQIASLFIVFGKLNGLPAACLVRSNTPGVTVTPIKNMMGFKAGHLGEVSFKEVLVPAENIVGKPGFGLSHIVPYGLHYGRISTACSAWGLMRACFEDSVSYVSQREVDGAKLQEKGVVRQIIADMGVQLEAAGQLCINACQLEEAHSHDAMEKTLIAKYFTSRAVVKAASDAVQVRGASGCHESAPVARYYRDAKIMEIIEGTSQLHLDILGKNFINRFQNSH